MKIYVKSSKQPRCWNSMSGADQYAAEMAISYYLPRDIADCSDEELEDAAWKGCQVANEGNAEPEYENEDFYMDEANLNTVLEYLKSRKPKRGNYETIREVK